MRVFVKYSIFIIILSLIVLTGLFLFNGKKPHTTIQVPEGKNTGLESFYTDLSEYEKAFQNLSGTPKQKITAGIVSHHFLAKELIARFFSGIDATNVKNVYIVGPDHYESLSDENFDYATSVLDWDTPFGILHANQGIKDLIKNQSNGIINDTIFKNEHSIYTLVPFVKKVFPDADITPLVLKTSTTYQTFYTLGEQFYRDDSILIVSSDFSHNVTEKKAKENDIKSIQSLTSLNVETIGSIESDCKQCIAFLYGFISNSPSKLTVLENKTSADFDSNDERNLTSYISSYFVPDDIRLVFGGDMMLDRYIRFVANKQGYDYIFEMLRNYLLNKDLVIVNLEGPITPYASVSVGTEAGSKNNYLFTFDEKVADVISKNNITLVNIGNNHVLNFDVDGYDFTKQSLSKSNVKYFGNTDVEDITYETEIKGKKLAFINYNQFENNNLEKTLNDIRELQTRNDFVFVYAHWGDEYSTFSTYRQKELAHAFVDAGADSVIGSHPHVIQETETYREKKIYYSLGNFVFDQYFSDDTQKGLLVEAVVDFKTNTLRFNDHHITLQQNGQTNIVKTGKEH